MAGSDSQPRRELNRARDRLTAMQKAEDFDSAEHAWRDCLGDVERAFHKIEAAYNDTPGYVSWHERGQVQRDRKRDPLIQYVQQARHADEHTLAETTRREPGGIGIGAGPSGSVYIEHLEVSGDQISGKWQGDLRVTFHPARLRLLPVTNRGRTYQPPTQHLGQSLGEPGPAQVAEAAITYYEKYLDNVEARFG